MQITFKVIFCGFKWHETKCNFLVKMCFSSVQIVDSLGFWVIEIHFMGNNCWINVCKNYILIAEECELFFVTHFQSSVTLQTCKLWFKGLHCHLLAIFTAFIDTEGEKLQTYLRKYTVCYAERGENTINPWVRAFCRSSLIIKIFS